MSNAGIIALIALTFTTLFPIALITYAPEKVVGIILFYILCVIPIAFIIAKDTKEDYKDMLEKAEEVLYAIAHGLGEPKNDFVHAQRYFAKKNKVGDEL